MKIAAIILASGLSRRMGSNKLLIDIDGQPLIQYILQVVAKADFYKRIIVTTYPEIVSMAEAYGFEAVHNDNPYIGQSRSVVLGTKAVDDVEAFMFFTGDMPNIKEATVCLLKQAAEKNTDAIIVPRYNGKNGSPVIFSRDFKQQLLELTGDFGGRYIIQANKERTVYVDIEDAGQGLDIDEPDDLQRIEGK